MLLSVEFDPFLQDPGRICDCPVKTSTAGNNPLENVSSLGANRTQSTDHREDSAEGDVVLMGFAFWGKVPVIRIESISV